MPAQTSIVFSTGREIPQPVQSRLQQSIILCMTVLQVPLRRLHTMTTTIIIWPYLGTMTGNAVRWTKLITVIPLLQKYIYSNCPLSPSISSMGTSKWRANCKVTIRLMLLPSRTAAHQAASIPHISSIAPSPATTIGSTKTMLPTRLITQPPSTQLNWRETATTSM